ncbi:MAG: diaminopimelate decarboxylase [Phycisphaerae bacterium]|jgi:diaminopimelate decarboxylase|nr:diaminopimelate decarboxylase [Phycisphaerae bacterium]
MDLFQYRNNELFCEEVSIEQIVRDVGTPCYVYSASTLVNHYKRIADAFAELDPLICYSIKSCSNLHICKLLASAGAGFDVVSGGELYRGIQAGGDPAKMVYAGVGKTDAEINQALDAGLGWFNIESVPELENLQKITAQRKIVSRAALRINPDIDPKTHRYTATGKKHSKFGVAIERAEEIVKKYAKHDYLRMTGLHLHIGSPINSTEPFIEAIEKVLRLIDGLRKDGFEIDTLDIGGGFGADYTKDQSPVSTTYAAAMVPLLKNSGLKIIMEPGRSIAANSGILVTQVLFEKDSEEKSFAIVDAGMNDLIRPALYEAFHFIWPTKIAQGMLPPVRSERPDLPNLKKYDVVGPICESGDCFAHDRYLPRVNRGELMAIFTAGAYGFSMSSQYNSRPRAAEVLVQGNLTRLIRRRETYQDLIQAEVFE